MIMMFWLLIGAHFVCDYPLQGDFLAKAKNRFAPISGVPFYQALGAHAIIHGAAVALITGSVLLGVLEVICHAIIDDRKCGGHLSFNQDQMLHLICKALWCVLAVWVV